MQYSQNSSLYRNSLILFLLFLIQSCQAEIEESAEDNNSIISTTVPIDSVANADLLEADDFSFSTVFTDNQGWGYQIFNNEKLYINQPHIPAIEGVNGFSSEQKAAKTAQFAIYKIENGILPPTISKNELDSLGVLE